jgi:hypothetical protein
MSRTGISLSVLNVTNWNIAVGAQCHEQKYENLPYQATMKQKSNLADGILNLWSTRKISEILIEGLLDPESSLRIFEKRTH